MNREYQEVKYIRELTEYFQSYINAIINEIYIGVGTALGLDDKTAYRLASTPPGSLQKARFFKNILERFKNIFKHRHPKFNFNKKVFGTGQPMTDLQWQIFNKSIDKYWQDFANTVTEDVAVKAFMLGKATTNFRKTKKPYQNKSLYQVQFEQYKGEMPKTIKQAYENYDFTNAERNALNKTYSRTAMYVTQANNDIKAAIRNQVQSGIDENKSSVQTASDLYWEVQKNEKFTNKYTAQSLRRNWNRVASTEIASIYEAGILAPHEAEAMESLKDVSKVKYFVFTGGQCPWCTAHHGTLVRLVPASIVSDTSDDSLKSMGIDDPNTDIAVWVGKNNVGYKENKSEHGWRVCTPAHPHNVATLQPIDLSSEYYNPKTDRIEHQQKKYKHVPQQLDYTYQSKEEQEYEKPHFVGDNLVRRGYNVYEAVAHEDYVRKLKQHRADASTPIPVDEDSTDYRYIFEAAGKNQDMQKV